MTEKGIGDRFQDQTSYERGNMPRGRLNMAQKPAAYKTYPSAPRVALPAPETADGMGVWETLARRRSERRYVDQALQLMELSQLLWAAQGVTAEGYGVKFRTAPSAGALYPVETYLVVHAVEGIEPGVYHYVVGDHELEQLETGDFRRATAQAALDQEIAYRASVVFVWTAVFARSKWKYRQRAYRYIYLDAGHIAQNVALAAVALDLGSCQVAALYDDEANALLGVDGKEESTIYMTTVGRSR
jgi:SagB-type dehydrogenase family enzyme